MRAAAKVGLVAAGYVGALVIASVVVVVYVASTSGSDRQTYGAMYDFGDSLLFLAVFGVAAVPASGAALFFLRPYPAFWRFLCAAALAVAASGIVAVINKLISGGPGSAHHVWLDLAGLGVLIAPLFALGFCLSAVFAPHTRFRIALFAAM